MSNDNQKRELITALYDAVEAALRMDSDEGREIVRRLMGLLMSIKVDRSAVASEPN